VSVAEVKPDLLAAISSDGLWVEGQLTLRVKCPRVFYGTDILRAGPYDLILLMVKVPSLGPLASALKHYDYPQTQYVVGCNGLGSEVEVVQALGPERVLRAIINFAAQVESPGVRCLIAFMDQTLIGPVNMADFGPAQAIAQLFTEAQLPARPVIKIESSVWEKAILSAALSAICAITHSHMKAVITHPAGHELMVRVLREGITVAQANGISLRPDFFEYALQYLESSGEHFPSLAMDLHEGRDLEIEVLNGAIVAAGKRCGVPTPYNDALTMLVRFLHRPRVI
jgi:2-dehydropantoate 2-reductase